MAKSNNPYKDLNIDRSKMEEAVRALGAGNYEYRKVGHTFQMSFTFDGAAHKLAVYENNNGKTTLSQLGGDAELFNKVATAIRDGCKIGEGGPFELSLPRFKEEKLSELLEYLTTEGGAQPEREAVENGYRLVRLKGRQGDSLVVKLYKNGTLQLQGRRAMLASMVLDYVGNVLGYNEAVKAQLDVFQVPVQLPEIRKEVEGRLPMSFVRVSEVVKTQLTTALAMSKVDMPLPDYGAIAFPALKGLEGFIKTELKTAGLNPGPAASFGEYFESRLAGGGHQMRTVQAQHVGEPAASLLASCYTIWSSERHGIAHVGTGVENTRILPDLLTARNVITKVFDIIEQTCIKLPA